MTRTPQHWQPPHWTSSEHYDFDLVKVTPASSFSIKDWGAEDVWEGHTEGTRRYTKRVIQKPQDWERLPVLDPAKADHLSGQMSCLRQIRSALGPDVPLLQTIFNPLSQAKNLAGGDVLIAHLRLYPEAVLKGLQTIAETTRRFVEAASETGIDGIFYAVQHAQAGLLTLDEYKTFGLSHRPEDLAQPAANLWCNLLHLHGLNIYFDLVHCLLLSFTFSLDRQLARPRDAPVAEPGTGKLPGSRLRRDQPKDHRLWGWLPGPAGSG